MSRKTLEKKMIDSSLLTEARKKIEELREQRDRALRALWRIAESVDVVTASRAFPKRLRPGMDAIAREAREYAK